MFSGISSCGTLRFALWQLTEVLHGAKAQASWAFISFDFSLVGLHLLSFWPCGPSFPFILAFLALIYLHFCLLGLVYLSFWPSGPSFPCILAFWAFISLHFGLVGFHFLAFWPRGPSFPCIFAFSGSASGVLPTSCQKWPVCPTSLQWIYQRRDRLHFAVFSLVGLHFLAFWPCGLSFPCILASWAFISLHFCLFGVSFWGPPHKLPKMARLPNVLTMDLSAP